MKNKKVITKKLIVTPMLLLVVIIIALPLSYLPIKHFIFEFQQEALTLLKPESVELTTLTLSLKEYQDLQIEKEFFYQGYKYDLYEAKQHRDSVCIKALKDIKETLLDNLHKEINSFAATQKKIGKVFSFYFYQPIEQAYIFNQPYLKHNQQLVILYKNSFYSSIVKPPQSV